MNKQQIEMLNIKNAIEHMINMSLKANSSCDGVNQTVKQINYILSSLYFGGCLGGYSVSHTGTSINVVFNTKAGHGGEITILLPYILQRFEHPSKIEDAKQSPTPVWPFPVSPAPAPVPHLTNRTPHKINLVTDEKKTSPSSEPSKEELIKKYDQVKKYFV